MTLQIGDGQTISNISKCTTVSNFRALDVSLNGQGAPLVPIGDLHLFSKYKYCLNIGGFANISIKKNNSIIAYDICPANIILNHISNKINFDFDIDGKISASGKIDSQFLKKFGVLDSQIKNISLTRATGAWTAICFFSLVFVRSFRFVSFVRSIDG